MNTDHDHCSDHNNNKQQSKKCHIFLTSTHFFINCQSTATPSPLVYQTLTTSMKYRKNGKEELQQRLYSLLKWDNQLVVILHITLFFLFLTIYFRSIKRVSTHFRLRIPKLYHKLLYLATFMMGNYDIIYQLESRVEDQRGIEFVPTPIPLPSSDNSSDKVTLRPTLKLMVQSTNISSPTLTAIAALDSGANTSLISRRLVDRLEAKSCLVQPVCNSGFPGENFPGFIFRSVRIELYSLHNQNVRTGLLNMLVDDMGFIGRCASPPKQLINMVKAWHNIDLSNDTCAHENLNDQQEYDLLIGQDLLGSQIYFDKQNSCFLTPDLALIPTKFGYTVQGIFDPNSLKQIKQEKSFPPENKTHLVHHSNMKEIYKDLTMQVYNSLWHSIYCLPSLFIWLTINATVFIILLLIISIAKGILNFIRYTFLALLYFCSSFETCQAYQARFIYRFARETTCLLNKLLSNLISLIKTTLLHIKIGKRNYKANEISHTISPTLQVSALNRSLDRRKNVFLLIDTGSTFSFISSDLATCLRATIEPLQVPFIIKPNIKIRSVALIHLESLTEPTKSIQVKLYLYPQKGLGFVAPCSPLIRHVVCKHFGLDLNCLPLNCKRPVDLLIGTDMINKLLLPQQNSICLTSRLRLVPSTLGWSLSGTRKTKCDECHNFYHDNFPMLLSHFTYLFLVMFAFIIFMIRI